MVKKRFIACLLIFAMFFVFATPAFADDSGWEMVMEDPDEREPFPEDEGEEINEPEDQEPEDVTEPEQPEITEPEEGESQYIDEDTTWLRIGLKYASTAVTTSSVSCEDGFLLVSFNGNRYEILEDLTEYTSVAIKAADGRVSVLDSDDQEITVLEPSMALLSAAEEPDDRIVTIDGSKYRDGASYKLVGSSMSVINRISLEHYLWGVIANEMGYLYPKEALKAQAVTARSFALTSISRHGSYGFDLCTGQNCQVYRGVAAERTETVTACKETEGEVLKYQNKTVSGYYYAYSWGYTMDSDKVWASQPGYLYGIEDEYVQEYMWKTSFTFDQLKVRMDALGYNGGNVSSVQITGRAENNAVTGLSIKTDTISFVISKSNITGLLSSLGVKSLCFYISGEDYPAKEAQGRDAVYAMDGRQFAAEDTVSVIGADGKITEAETGNLYVTDGKTTAPALTVTVTGYVDKTADNGMVYLTGYGYGHGVGMPQTSAKNMAEAGHDYKEILKYYYTGIEIKQYK